MKLLAVETATELCSAALWIDGQVLEQSNLQTRGQTHCLLPMIESILGQANVSLPQLNAIAFGKGPGAFTGLRVGVGVAQGLAFAHDLPVIPVSSLASLAQGQQGDHILVALDARMGQVYWGAYQRTEDSRVELIGQEQVYFPRDIPVPDALLWTGAGSGWDVYHESLAKSIGQRLKNWKPSQFPQAGNLVILAVQECNLGKAVAAEQGIPEYIRNRVVDPPAGRLKT